MFIAKQYCKLVRMKSIFLVLLMSIAGYQTSAQEIIDLTKLPAVELDLTSANMTEDFMETLRQKIPNEIRFPDQNSKGGPEFICASTSFKLVDSFIKGLKDFDYEFDYSGLPLPSSYSFKITFEIESSYALSCSPWFKFQGPLNISVVNMQFDGTIKNTLEPPTIRFKTMDTKVDGVNININGVFSDATSAIISMILTDRATDLVNENQEQISNRLMKYINDILEEILPGSNDVGKNQTATIDESTDINRARASSTFKSAFKEVIKLVESVSVH